MGLVCRWPPSLIPAAGRGCVWIGRLLHLASLRELVQCDVQQQYIDVRLAEHT